MEFKDYYQTLGVEATASDAEIKTAFRRLARKFHPDVIRAGTPAVSVISSNRYSAVHSVIKPDKHRLAAASVWPLRWKERIPAENRKAESALEPWKWRFLQESGPDKSSDWPDKASVAVI